MAVRRWAVWPNGMGVVDRNEFVQALMDGEAMLHRAGGVLTVIVGRAPTELDGEMVTTGAIFEWKDRTDARAQPEPAADVLASTPTPPAPAADPEAAAPADAPGVAEAAAADDGLDEASLPEEDTSSIEPALR